MGSSPRMRGTHTGVAQAGQQSGIIPAYAGNTGCMRPVFSIHKDHPRVCGEHMLRERRIVWQAGSSPRMRGTRHRRIGHGPVEGIIPAYAGNTFYKKCGCVRHWDHPRVCGEHNRIVGIIAVILGSSPRMRGTLQCRSQRHQSPGIIPAYAGNTAWPTWGTPSTRDHPRVCGEHYPSAIVPPSARGSSPRMRGTPLWSHCVPRARGIIPAYAGNTGSVEILDDAFWDHPRVCGEHPSILQ